MKALVNLNGKISSPEDAKVSIFDRGFLFGDGVYETGTAYQRCPLFMEEHIARLRRSAEKLFIPVPWTDADLRKRLWDTAKMFGQDKLYFRIIVTRGVVSHLSLDALENLQPTLVIVVNALNMDHYDKLRREGISLATSKILRNSALAQDPDIKTSNYLNSLLAFQDAKKKRADDAVLCDANRNVTEGTTFSIFGINDKGELLTPSLEVGILDSITRRHILSLARPVMPVIEGCILLEKLQSCSEVFIASSIREIVPVKSWDGKSYSVTGEKTRKLHALLRADFDRYIQAHEKY